VPGAWPSGDAIVKIKLLAFLSAGCLVTLAALYVSRAFDSELGAQAGERSKEGGVPEEYSATVSKGLEYLAKNQCKDGHWEGDDGKHPVAMTGLVGLALLMEKEAPRSGRERVLPPAKYLANIRKAADWLIDKSQGRDGLIFSDHASERSRYMEGHGLATLFLAGACRDEEDPARRKKLTEVLTRAVKYIARAQSTQGGWYHTSKVEGHDFDEILATVIQVQALRAAENADISIPGEIINHARHYLDSELEKYEKAKPKKNSNRTADTVAALVGLVRVGFTTIGDKLSTAETKEAKWLKYCQSKIPVGRDIKLGRDELIHYYYAQAVYHHGDGWTDYRKRVFDYLQESQNKDGGWPSGDGIGVGQTYSTAIWCVVLQLDRGRHPSQSLVGQPISVTRRFQPGPALRLASNLGVGVRET
jgi:hypothetical protein